jgi:hypothetical protein
METNSFAIREDAMIFAKQNGRLKLLERMRQLLSAGQTFTLSQAIDVFEESFANDRIEETTDRLMLAAWPTGRLGKRYFDVALCRSLRWQDEEWEEPPCHFPSSCFKLNRHDEKMRSSSSSRAETPECIDGMEFGIQMESKLTLWGAMSFSIWPR